MGENHLETILSKLENLENRDIEINFDDDNVYIHLFSWDEFEEGQIGYRIDPDGNSLLGLKKGDWKESWYVIGYDDELGDPVFVDINKKRYPIMTAMHGEGDWEPDLMYSSLDEFLESIL